MVADPYPQTPDYEEPGGELNLRDYLLVVMRHRGVILAVTLGVLFFTAVYAFSQKPVYYAQAAVAIQPESLNIGEQVYRQMYWYSATMIVETQMEVARSRSVAEMAVSRLGVDRTAELLGLPRGVSGVHYTVSQLAGMLLGRVRVKPRKDTFIFDIGVFAPSPQAAALISNTWAESLIDFNRESEVQLSRSTSEALAAQVERLQKSIAQKEARLNQMAEQAQIQILDQQLNVAAQKLDQLNRQLLEVQKEITDKAANLERIRNTPAESLPEVITNEAIQSLQKDCDEARQEYAEKSRIFKPDWPGLKQLRAKRDERCGQLERQIQALRQRLVRQAQADLDATRSKEREIRNQFAATRREIDDLNKKTTEYQTLKTDLENEKNLLEKMIARRQTAQLTEVGGIQFQTPMRIVEMASPPGGPVRPNRPRLLMMGLILGLMGGVGLAFLLHMLDNKVRTHEEVERLTSFRCLAFIPDTSQEEDTNVLNNAFRFLTEYLAFLKQGETPPRLILVTSSQPSEGKTFIATNLAINLAMNGRKVLLIDTDIHRASIHRVFEISRDPGFITLLHQAERPDFSIYPAFHQGLVVVPGCPPESHQQVSLLMEESILRKIFSYALRRFDYVILDSAPILAVPETTRLLRVSEGVLFVIRSDYTTRTTLKLAVDSLKRVDARVLGAVLNMVDMVNRYSYYNFVYPYRYYYTYQEKESPTARA